MYARHFGLQAEPFALTPDPSFLYLSPGHLEALAALKIGLTSRRGLTVMTGEVGTGKTTLLYSLLSELGADVRAAYIANTRLPFDDLLRQALVDFGVPDSGDTRLDLLRALNNFLLKCVADGVTPALVLDEAQNLDDDAFENLRLLSNFETFSTKLLQILLVGQSELYAKLSRPALRQVAERVAVCARIRPLTWRQSQAYIAHRLQRAGGSADLFTRNALLFACFAAGGIPRRINIICHNALLFAYGQNASRVSLDNVRAAARGRASSRLATLRWWRYRAAQSIPRPARTTGLAHREIVQARIPAAPVGTVIQLTETDIVRPGLPLESLPAHGLTRPLRRWLGPALVGGAAGLAVAGVAAPSRQSALPVAHSLPDPAAVAEQHARRQQRDSLNEGAAAATEPRGGAAARADTTAAQVARVPAAAVPLGVQPFSGPAGPAFAATADHAGPARAGEGTDPGGAVAKTGAPESATASAAGTKMVAVSRGDTLTALVQRVYGYVNPQVLRQVQSANRHIRNPNHIFAGDTLRFPQSRDSQDEANNE